VAVEHVRRTDRCRCSADGGHASRNRAYGHARSRAGAQSRIDGRARRARRRRRA
jgi:hypothetical protein